MEKRCYGPAELDTDDLVRRVTERFHPELLTAEVHVAVLMTYPPVGDDGKPTGPAIEIKGHACAGRIGLCNEKNRRLHGYDAIMELAADRWEEKSDRENEAVVDHELEHLVLVVKEGTLQKHVDGHPRIKLQPDDWMLTGFVAVAERHPANACEVQALCGAVGVLGGQANFPWFEDGTKKKEKKKGKTKQANAKRTAADRAA